MSSSSSRKADRKRSRPVRQAAVAARKLERVDYRQLFLRYAQIVLGALISALGYNLFLLPAHLLTGGLSGIAIIIYYLTGLPVGAVVKKFYAIDAGTVIFALNLLIVAASAFMFTVEEALFTLIAIYIIAEFTNRFAAGFNREKSVMIISPQAEAICQDIMESMSRGVTFIDGRGGFTDEPKRVLLVVVTLTQVGRVKIIVHHHDPQAFMIVSDTSEVSGKGFTLKSESYEDAKRKWMEQKQKQAERRS